MTAEEQWVEVKHHDARWTVLYANEAVEICSALGAYVLGLEHFGSTAVPGLLAKTIVDILIGAREDSATDAAVAALGQRVTNSLAGMVAAPAGTSGESEANTSLT